MDENFMASFNQLPEEERRKFYQSLKVKYSPLKNQDSGKNKEANSRRKILPSRRRSISPRRKSIIPKRRLTISKKKNKLPSKEVLQDIRNLQSNNSLSEKEKISKMNKLPARVNNENAHSTLSTQVSELSTVLGSNIQEQSFEKLLGLEHENNNLTKEGETENYIVLEWEDYSDVEDSALSDIENDASSDIEDEELLNIEGGTLLSDTGNNQDNDEYQENSLISRSTSSPESSTNASEEKVVDKEMFLNCTTEFFKRYEKLIEVKDRFIVGFNTQRSTNGLWLLSDNQLNYRNPVGRLFTKKRGAGYHVYGRNTTYWCKNCRGKYSSQQFRDNLVELKVKFKDIQSISGEHHKLCREVTFKELMGEEFFKNARNLAKHDAMTPKVSWFMGEGQIEAFADFFDFGLGVLKSTYGDYSRRGHTLRTAASRNAVKLENGKFLESVKKVRAMGDNKQPLDFIICGEPGDDLIILGTKKGLEIYNRSKIRMSDGTFYVAPKSYAQLYVVIAVLEENKNNEKRIEFLPVAFRLMKTKTEEMYAMFWNTLIEEMRKYGITHTEPKMFITDKEHAMVNIIDQLYPGKHSTRLIKLLTRLRKGSDNENHLLKFYENFRKIIALPLLPKQLITEQYFRTERDLLYHCEQWMTSTELKQLKKWTKYLRDAWFNVSESELKKICKFRTEIRNTNGSETTNRQINSHPYCRKKRGCIGIQFEEKKKTPEFAFRLRNARTVRKEEKLRLLQNKFEESNFTDVNIYLNDVAELFMPLKFKQLFEEIASLMRIQDTTLDKAIENLTLEEQFMIENAFEYSTYRMLDEIGVGPSLPMRTSSGREVKANSKFYDKQYTDVNNFKHKYTIQNFSLRSEKTGEKIISPTFVIGSKERSEWCLHIYPSGINEDSKEYVSVYLTLLKPDKAKAKYRFSILNDEGEEKNVKFDTDFRDFVKNKGWGYPEFVKRDFLLNKSNGLLINDKLTIICEAEIIDLKTENCDNPETSINISIPQSKLLLNYGNMFDSSLFADYIIKVGNTEIKVHKAVLASQSPVFYDILNSTSEESQKNIIEIKDFNAEVVKKMLKYIYKDEVSDIRDMEDEMFEIASKYELHRLKVISEQFMCNSLSIENVCERFALSDKYPTERLKEHCEELILKNLEFLIETSEWKKFVFVRPLLLESLFSKSLNISSTGSNS
uniref:MATH domain-containing protein n=1 Tax=Strongyloides papillosus TaxID=174720 RepID=A0A0N5B3M8_STREA